jgi:class 3 adenylate cyclase/SAM-dependent methyltransferase
MTTRKPKGGKRSSRKAASALDRRFAELLDTLGLEIPKGSRRPVARDQRLSEEIMEAFLDVSGDQLVELLRGKEGTRSHQEIPLHQLEAVVSLFYGTIHDSYIGVDSHSPSRFLQVHPFLLENLAQDEAAEESVSIPREHEECHAPLCVRIVPLTAEMLQQDLDDWPGVRRYYNLHQKHSVTLLSVTPQYFRELREGVLSGEWTGDIGLWLNTCALLFEPSIIPGNNKLRLELLYPYESRFETYRRYVGELLKKSERVYLSNDEIKTEELDPEVLDHLHWSLESMFQPNLADVWDQFVAPKKRVSRLGPFVEERIEEMGLNQAKILDAAMGVGCDSVHLAEQGHTVVSNEIDPRLIAHAVELNQRNGNAPLDIRRFDWRHFEHLAEADTFDVVLALGNSLSCLYSASDVRTVLIRFAHLLRPDGLLIVDERDYTTMFDERGRMAKKDFFFPGEVVYCSRSIQARPRRIPREQGMDNELLTLEYIRAGDGEMVGTFDVLPFRDGQLVGLLEETGFRNVKRYYNLKPRRGSNPVQFLTYVASRGYDTSDWAEPGRYRETVIAFTDITASTQAKKRLGERRYVTEWQAHERQVKRCVEEHHGKVVNDTGDGFLLYFNSPVSAVDCLSTIIKAPGTSEFSVRAGVHKGRAVTDAEGKLRGGDVHVASRICDSGLARPDHLVADDQIPIKVAGRTWRKEPGVELRGIDKRDLWILED